MSLSIGKRDVARLAAVLDAEYDSLDEAASAVLTAAWELYEQKANWIVAAQVNWGPGGYLDKDDIVDNRVAVVPFGTETQARNAAMDLAFSKQTGEECKAWLVPYHHGTAAAFFKQRADARKKVEAKADTSQRAKREAALERRTAFWAANPGAAALPDDIDDEVGDYCYGCGRPLDAEEAA